jgi:hypothetical protein
MIHIELPTYFSSPDGHDLSVVPGRYTVVAESATTLRLEPEDGRGRFFVAARSATHDIDLTRPFVLSFTEPNEATHVLVLAPDGTALEAVGSPSTVRSRDARAKARHYQLKVENGTVTFGDGTKGRIPAAATSTTSAAYGSGIGSVGSTKTGGELQMIQLQSLISQRQTAIALTDAILRAHGERFHFEYNINRPGGDYAERSEATAESCRAVCINDTRCQAFTFVEAPPSSQNGQCYLKQTVPAQVAHPCCISAKRKSTQDEIVGNIR